MKDVYAKSGEYDLLAILRATPRGGRPVVPDQPRGSPAETRPSAPSAPEAARLRPARYERPTTLRAEEPAPRGSTVASNTTGDGRPPAASPPTELRQPSPPTPHPSGAFPVEDEAERASLPKVPPSEWWDGTEDWPVEPPKLDADGRIEGVIYTPDTRPPFDPTSKQRWDRRYREREAANRAKSGDLTLHALLTFREMLPPEERVLPEPTDPSDPRPS